VPNRSDVELGLVRLAGLIRGWVSAGVDVDLDETSCVKKLHWYAGGVVLAVVGHVDHLALADAVADRLDADNIARPAERELEEEVRNGVLVAAEIELIANAAGPTGDAGDVGLTGALARALAVDHGRLKDPVAVAGVLGGVLGLEPESQCLRNISACCCVVAVRSAVRATGVETVVSIERRINA